MQRRDFLKYGTAATTASLVAGSVGLFSYTRRADAVAGFSQITLNTVAGDVAMVDGVNVHMLTFSGGNGPSFPGPSVVCTEGDTVEVTVNNSFDIPVAFKIGGANVRQVVAANGSSIFSFTAPAAGTYLYYDDQNNGVNRVVGLHGALIVMPQAETNRSFAAGPTFVRQYKWLLASVDSAWGAQLRSNGPGYVSSINANTFLPRYFTINGKSFPDTHNGDIMPAGRYYEPALVRMLNAGGMVNAPHFHGNHVEIVSVNRQNFAANRKKKDVVTMFPLDVKDVLIPFIPPPDAYPPIPTSQMQHFPMHCHIEMSQTAGGGSYPNGLHTGLHFGMAPHHEPHL